MTDFTPLDNPIWNALTSEHRSIARCVGLAARYQTDISPLAGVSQASTSALADLRSLFSSPEYAALFTTEPVDVPPDWNVVRTRWIDQMVYDHTTPESHTTSPHQIVQLGDADIPEMLALTAATQPGPFSQRTILMGRYFGIRSPQNRLIAMAGERLQLQRFTEMSAVCTDPQSRGQGLGAALLRFLIELIRSENKTPFLHVKTENAAKLLYEKVGLRQRRPIRLTVITPAIS